MPTHSDDFAATWQSLSDTHRSFLLAAYDIDKRLPHSEGLDKILPAICWRSVGVKCWIRPNEVDELVRALTASRLVHVLDSEHCKMALLCGHQIRELLGARRRQRYRRVLSTVLIAAGVLLAILGLAVHHESARFNVWTAAFGMLIWGMVIRFQHVRL